MNFDIGSNPQFRLQGTYGGSRDEQAARINYEANKTSGSDTGLLIQKSGATSGSGTSLLLDATMNGSSMAWINDEVVAYFDSMVGIGDAAPSVALDVVGDINYTGVLVDVSDRRQKENIRNLTGALDKLRYVEGVSFTMKDDPGHKVELGLIAQDVEQVYPALVHTDPQGVKSLNYTGMIGPLVEAVKELDAQNNALADENAELRKMIHDLSARMDVIEGHRRPKYAPYND
ncbi:MAG: tail fiber domain-containing protein, partial [Alphaproteobacteria bacterium]